MTRRTLGLLLFAIGVTSFFVGMFSIPREGALYAAIFGAILILISIVVLLFALRHTFRGKPSLPLVLIVASAIALHAYQAFLHGNGDPSIGFFCGR